MLQVGKPGDRFMNTQDQPRILFEVPDLDFEMEWEKLFLAHLAAGFRKKGVPRSHAKDAATQFLKEWRRFSDVRVSG